jgi:NitT/TauT family transport system ATP-binding protein
MTSIPVHAPADVHVRVCDLSHEYAADAVAGAGALRALTGITFAVRRGEFFSIIGPSGCGKSTLLRVIGGLLTPSQGEVLVNTRPPREAQRAKAIGFVFQDPALLPWRTVAANVALALEVNHRAGRQPPPDIDSLLALVGLAGFGRYYPYQLSGGMQQRVALARALATDPSLLLMDEPFGALDEITRTELRYELLRITARTGKTVVFVTHSLTEAVLLSDRVAVMTPRPGRIRAVVEIGLPHPRDAVDETDRRFAEHVRALRALLREP